MDWVFKTNYALLHYAGKNKNKQTMEYLYILYTLLFQPVGHVWLFCDLMDCSLPDSSVRGIFQASILEWVAIPFPGILYI